MINSWHPDTVQPTAGHYVGEVVQRLGGKTRGGIYVLGNDNNTRMDTCVVRVLRMGLLPALATLGASNLGATGGVAGVGAGFVKDARRAWPPEFLPVKEGSCFWTSRDFPKVWIHRDAQGVDRKYVLGRYIDALAVIEDWDPTLFEQVA